MIIIANWKMNPLTINRALNLLNFYKKLKYKKIWIAPPFVFLPILIKKYKKTFIFGAQNVHHQKEGAYTGEISATMLKNIGCKFVIINHSERRKIGETLEIANQKIRICLKNNLIPVVCFGEQQKISNLMELKNLWEKEFQILFKDIDNFKKIKIVYEPAWAISTEKIGPVPLEIVSEFLTWIKTKTNTDIFYGGSLSDENIEDYLKVNLKGFLIGSQSLKMKNFGKIIQKIKKYDII
ncbi:MAG: triose-phosphate isomerase [Minisyncoccia bacterium]|jgi:triosephosphate isomerase